MYDIRSTIRVQLEPSEAGLSLQRPSLLALTKDSRQRSVGRNNHRTPQQKGRFQWSSAHRPPLRQSRENGQHHRRIRHRLLSFSVLRLIPGNCFSDCSFCLHRHVTFLLRIVQLRNPTDWQENAANWTKIPSILRWYKRLQDRRTEASNDPVNKATKAWANGMDDYRMFEDIS